METWFKKIWEHRVTSLAFVMVGCGIAVFFILHSPVPGVAVTVLAVVAAIMSIRPLSSWEKFIYMALVFLLLYAEIHAITVDRREQLRHQLEAEAEQNLGFQGIRQQQNQDFQSTAAGLSSAIEGLKKVLSTTDTTLNQTAPHALFGATHNDWGNAVIRPGASFLYNVSFTNTGSELAKKARIYSKMYTGKPDDIATQEQLYFQFEKDWTTGSVNTSVGEVPINSEKFVTFQSVLLSESEITQMQASTLTIYTFTRIAYSDSGGNWYSDTCDGLQLPLQAAGLPAHPCDAKYNNKRYKPNRH
ncbi:hypothetical protein [Granulicella sp. S156]|uniref:hypothetical protein n=1 Tax=Granulicella sp. S156 TaxID=1747224 RepID=UPI00131DE47E|nr:hypothetical protein [Granulicella sp. S156]